MNNIIKGIKNAMAINLLLIQNSFKSNPCLKLTVMPGLGG
jgi:hypothetical protein